MSSPAAAPAGAPEEDTPPSHRFFLAPLRHTKTLYLIRHGEGYHNLFGEKDHALYGSEKFFDAHLTPKGWDQCRALKKHLARAQPHDGKESLVDRLELVVVSPLMRALETAVGCLGGDECAPDATAHDTTLMLASEAEDEVRPGHAAVEQYMGAVRAPLKFLACELCREHIGKNPCDRRRKTSEYKAVFPGIDFSCVTEEEDKLWGTMNESNEMMCLRAHRFMEWVMRRPEQHVAVVTHSAFMAGGDAR